jgi:hypothetical protein
MLVHHVLFTLTDRSPQARQDLVAACRSLAGLPGIEYFAAGTLADDIQWSVSDRDFDVALLVVFRDKAAHDAYQDSPEHTQFLEQYGDGWAAVRSIDWYTGAPG